MKFAKRKVRQSRLKITEITEIDVFGQKQEQFFVEFEKTWVLGPYLGSNIGFQSS